jgi:cation:H+ antiporter
MSSVYEVPLVDLYFLAAGAIGLGIYLLIKSGGAVVDGAIYIAKQFGLPPMVVGFTIVACGTSLPELLVSVNANLKGFGGISIGNIVGSNIANILLILGVAATLAPMTVKRHACTRDMMMMLLATAGLVAVMYFGLITRWQGGLMLAVLAAYVFYQYRKAMEDKEPPPEEVEEADFASMTACLIALGLGLIGVSIGAEMLVRGTVVSANAIGIPESVVALTVVAFGTSLPELATVLISIRKGQTELIFGNIIGSNVFNILSIIGITALIAPIAVDPHLMGISLWVMVITSVLFVGWIMAFHKMQRPLGIIMVIAYVAFVASEYLLTAPASPLG